MKKIKINNIEFEIADGIEIIIDSDFNIKISTKAPNYHPYYHPYNDYVISYGNTPNSSIDQLSFNYC